jgi:UDPglucose 6-dehydrogenase
MKMVVDLKYVLAVARDCGKHINDYLSSYKSTVPVGTSKVKQHYKKS